MVCGLHLENYQFILRDWSIQTGGCCSRIYRSLAYTHVCVCLRVCVYGIILCLFSDISPTSACFYYCTCNTSIDITESYLLKEKSAFAFRKSDIKLLNSSNLVSGRVNGGRSRVFSSDSFQERDFQNLGHRSKRYRLYRAKKEICGSILT